jgi:hypothetical protein
MATCSTLGQAAGTAAAIAARDGLTPRGVYERRLDELKQTLMKDDCYLPFNRRAVNPLTARAVLTASSGDPEQLRNGWDRQIGAERNSWDAAVGDSVELDFGSEVGLRALRLVFDSDLSRSTHNMTPYYTLASQDFVVPPQLVKSFKVEVSAGAGSDWKTAAEVVDNHQRLVSLQLGVRARRLRFTPTGTWGAPAARVFALDVE